MRSGAWEAQIQVLDRPPLDCYDGHIVVSLTRFGRFIGIVGLFASLVGLGASCRRPEYVVPPAYRAVRPAALRQGLPTPEDLKQLRKELTRGDFRRGDVPPEQILVWAIAALSAHAYHDAMFYVIIADLRADQRIRMIYDGVTLDEDELRPLTSDERFNDTNIEDLRRIEANVLSHSDFDLMGELHWIATAIELGNWELARPEMQRPSGWAWPVQYEQRTIYEILASKAQFGASLPGEVSDPELFKTVTNTHARALAERNKDGKPHWMAIKALRRMALSSFSPWKQRALLATAKYCPGVDATGLARKISTLGPTLMAALKSGTPASRSTAAVVIGVARAPEYLDALKEALPAAPDLRVALSIRFALFSLGDKEQTQFLTDALEHDEHEIQEHAGCLLSWYDNDTVGDFVDDASLARVLATKGYPTGVRLVLAELLANVSRKRPLSEAATEYVFTALDSSDSDIVNATEPIIVRGVQFGRDEVMKRIAAHPHPTVYRALLMRLSKIAQPSDYDTFMHAVEHSANNSYVWNAAFAGAKAIPGETARDWMMDEYLELEHPATTLTCHMTERKDWTARQLQKLYDHDDPTTALLFKLSFGAPDAAASILKMLREGEWLPRSDATWWVELFKVKAVESELWKNAEYHKPEKYPQDAFVRAASLVTLLRLQLQRASQ